MEVPARVFILGLVAATYVPANQAFAQMNPTVSDPEALLASLGGGRYVVVDLVKVCTFSPQKSHQSPHILTH